MFKRMTTYLSVSVMLGIASAAAFNRLLDFFLLSMFLATATGLCIFLVLSRNLFRALEHSDFRNSLMLSGIAATVSLQLFFLSFIPLTVDRSFSVWLLARVDNSELNAVSFSTLEKDTQKFFLSGSEEIDRRLSEQKRLGNVHFELGESTLSLTNRGIFQSQINRLLCRFFGLRTKYANGA